MWGPHKVLPSPSGGRGGGAPSYSALVSGTRPQTSGIAEAEGEEEKEAIDFLKVCLPQGPISSSQVHTLID